MNSYRAFSVLLAAFLVSLANSTRPTIELTSSADSVVSGAGLVSVFRDVLTDLAITPVGQLGEVHSRIVEAALALVEESLRVNSNLTSDYPDSVISAYVYLSTAQDIQMKYWLLHKATYMLYSIPGMQNRLKEGNWPVSDRLLRTLYFNSERTQKKVITLPNANSNSMFLYNFYMNDVCFCTTRSWCFPYWFGKNFGHSFDLYIVPRDFEGKPVYVFDIITGCFNATEVYLSSSMIDNVFSYAFIFDINAFMDPEVRTLQPLNTVLYPAFWLTEAQISNFKDLHVQVIPDDSIFKPPNPQFMHALLIAASTEGSHPPNRLVYLAEVRPLKGQYEFLSDIPSSNSLEIDIVLMGDCVGNQMYCDKVQAEVNRLSPRVVWLGSQPDEVVASVLGTSSGLVLASITDCNPRVVFEALWAGIPFIVTEAARVPNAIRHLGIIHEDGNSWAETIAIFLQVTRHGRWNSGENPQLSFAKSFVTDNAVYTELTQMLKINLQS